MIANSARIGSGRGWQVAPEHFAERHGLIVLIALGESIIAIGVGAGFDLDPGVIAAAVLGIVVVSALWWLYFDVAAIFARTRLRQASGVELPRGARARERDVRGRRGVRGDSLSRAPAPGPAPDLRGGGGTRVPPPPPFAMRGTRRAPD